MKFVFTGGPLAYFEGYEFLYGKPVDVTNPATIQRIKSAPHYAEVSDSPVTEPVDKKACPKCGRVLKQGMFLHQKHCKGIK